MKNSILIAASLLLIACGAEEKKNDTKANDSTATATTEKTYAAELIQCLEKTMSMDGPFACLDQHNEMLNMLDTASADSVYFTVVNRMETIAGTEFPDFTSEDMDTTYYGPKKEIKEKYAAMGYAIDNEEGEFFFTIDYKILHERIGGILGQQMHAYSKFWSENDSKISYDAGLSLNPEQIAKRCLRMEEIILMGNFFFRESLMSRLSWELYCVFSGLDNTPAFDYTTGMMFEENKKAIQLLIKKGNKYTKPIAKEFWSYLEETEFKNQDDRYDRFNDSKIQEKMKAVK
jgi:hypothetical protein